MTKAERKRKRAQRLIAHLEGTCERKVRFKTLRIALLTRDAHDTQGVEPYLCVYCGGYHLGHPRKGDIPALCSL